MITPAFGLAFNPWFWGALLAILFVYNVYVSVRVLIAELYRPLQKLTCPPQTVPASGQRLRSTREPIARRTQVTPNPSLERGLSTAGRSARTLGVAHAATVHLLCVRTSSDVTRARASSRVIPQAEGLASWSGPSKESHHRSLLRQAQLADLEGR